MLLYRILCAILLAWSANWALGRPEAAELLEVLPEMAALGPLSAAFVGFIGLSLRQGWGVVVGFANGVWAGALAIGLSGVLYMLMRLAQGFSDGLITSFDRLSVVFADAADPLVEQVVNLPLLIVSLGAAALVGIVTEFLHWLLVRFRRKRQPTG